MRELTFPNVSSCFKHLVVVLLSCYNRSFTSLHLSNDVPIMVAMAPVGIATVIINILVIKKARFVSVSCLLLIHLFQTGLAYTEWPVTLSSDQWPLHATRHSYCPWTTKTPLVCHTAHFSLAPEVNIDHAFYSSAIVDALTV